MNGAFLGLFLFLMDRYVEFLVQPYMAEQYVIPRVVQQRISKMYELICKIIR